MINPRCTPAPAFGRLLYFSLFLIFCSHSANATGWQAAPCDPDSTHEYTITFPADASANCIDPDVDTIEINEIDCALLAIAEPVDVFFSASGDECYKIRRTYRVINWYEYDGESPPVVIGRDEDCDGVPGDEAIWVIVRPDETVYLDRNGNENSGNEIRNNRSCDTNAGEPSGTGFWANSAFNTEIESRGFWEYTQFIKVYDNVVPALTVTQPDAFCSLSSDFANGCPADVSSPFTVTDVCTPDDITLSVGLDTDVVDLNGDGELTAADFTLQEDVSSQLSNDGNGTYIFTGTYPLGRHMLLITAEDGCGNAIADFVVFEVVDCKAPTPICINGLAMDLLPLPDMTDADGDGDFDACANTVWASDFIASPVDDCSPPVKYSINRVGEQPDINQTGLVVTEEDSETTIVEIYAWDSADNPYAVQPDGSVGGPNYDFCETYILVQDNYGCREIGGMIAGVIVTEESETVAGVEVALSGAMDMSLVTAHNGTYQFTTIEPGYDYSVTPQMHENPLNGVSTFDLVLISKHILNVQLLDSPYKMIAADINNSKSISTFDLIQLQQAILQINPGFPDNSSWRFVDAAYVFPDPTNPWLEDFPEVYNVNNLDGIINNSNFIAIKIGDVNGSAATN